MNGDDIEQLGQTIAAIGVILAIVMTVGSAVAAPDRSAGRDAVAEKPTLVGSMSAGYDGAAYRLSPTGEQTWSWAPEGAISVNDVSRTAAGNTLVTYQRTVDERILTGFAVVKPGESAEVRWRHEFEVETVPNSEVHDAEQLPSGNIIVADMDRERLFIVSHETNQIVWQWNASSHYQPPAQPRTTDWLHINDVDAINSTHYLVSVRNANQLLIIERGSGVVEVVNADRDDSNDGACDGLKTTQLVGENPKCGSPEVLDHQHNPQWLGGSPPHILVADSENDRVVELERNATTGKWTLGWTDHGAAGERYDWPRDADRLQNGNTLVLDTRNDRLVEVAENGSVVWAATIPPESYDADRGGVERTGQLPQYESTGDKAPIQQPIAAVSALHGGVQYQFGSLPNWMGEWLFLGVLLATLATLCGVVIWATARSCRAVHRRVAA